MATSALAPRLHIGVELHRALVEDDAVGPPGRLDDLARVRAATAVGAAVAVADVGCGTRSRRVLRARRLELDEHRARTRRRSSAQASGAAVELLHELHLVVDPDRRGGADRVAVEGAVGRPQPALERARRLAAAGQEGDGLAERDAAAVEDLLRRHAGVAACRAAVGVVDDRRGVLVALGEPRARQLVAACR